MRNAVGDVIQFLYGEDGMDGAAIEGQKLEALKMDEARLRAVYRIDLAAMSTVPNWLKGEDAERLRASIDSHRAMDAEFQVPFLFLFEFEIRSFRLHKRCGRALALTPPRHGRRVPG